MLEPTQLVSFQKNDVQNPNKHSLMLRTELSPRPSRIAPRSARPPRLILYLVRTGRPKGSPFWPTSPGPRIAMPLFSSMHGATAA